MSDREPGLRIPAEGMIAANALLDAVISQNQGTTVEHNVESMILALSVLEGDDAVTGDSDDPGAPVPDAGDIVAASVVCIAWLAQRLAGSSGQELEVVVSDLRAFLQSAAVDSEPSTHPRNAAG